MCGIMGCIGERARTRVVAGLKLLEYRGYDSAGVSFSKGGRVVTVKKKGRIAELERALKTAEDDSRFAIGHTRWATHGRACVRNAHPFVSRDRSFALVHNGIIENHRALRAMLEREGYAFVSETDTECALHLIAREGGANLPSLCKALSALEGSYAFAILTNCGEIWAARKNSPLVVGERGGAYFLSSDIRTLSAFASRAAVLKDGEIARLTARGISLFDARGNPVPLAFFETDEAEMREEADSYMMKEICEIPRRIAEAKEHYVRSGGTGLSPAELRSFTRVIFLGCGTAYHSGESAAGFWRGRAKQEVSAVLASEYLYDRFPTDRSTLAVAISQSGETADTLRAAALAKRRGATLFAVTNAKDSSLARAADRAIPICAGEEVAVASTKAYNCQLIVLYLMGLEFARAGGTCSAETEEIAAAFDDLPRAVGEVLSEREKIREIAYALSRSKAFFVLGKREDLPAAREGALKLKEISYLFAEACASGELKHGPLALIERGVTVVLLSTQPDLYEKADNARAEVEGRGASVFAVGTEEERGEFAFRLPAVHPALSPVLAAVPLQLFAYYVAEKRGRDIDKPRNLAKSVTVE